ncbi:GspE/PulE family protein [Aureibacillus halotolerans]|uniref:Type IV pilus assembly protein PilB n=1 Tax=Aureibacillus halotolerans TaxID=1508390 RepID=A0A4R6TWQ3_9BACI|nr:GspE/PulE family protein [Aureibacillus halotolerans]TDQ38288.1 type IV pilus assembly protein PilB [Aureibacillus halotolerans]
MLAKKRIGDVLIEAGLITETQLSQALEGKREEQKLGDAFVERRWITEEQLLDALEVQMKIPRVDLFSHYIAPHVIRMVPKGFAQKNLVIPVEQNGAVLRVAMHDPLDYFVIEDLRMLTGFQIQPALAKSNELRQALARHYHFDESAESTDGVHIEDVQTNTSVPEEDAPIIRLVNQMIQLAIDEEASDIHLDPGPHHVVMRYRVDGLLKTIRTVPGQMQNALTARLKIMAQLDITETRLPQDGRIQNYSMFPGTDFRLSVLPTVNGEKIVIRILHRHNDIAHLDKLSLSPSHLDKFKTLLEQPNGFVLVTGPTGAGKSSTLYASLQHLLSDEVNVVTIEDPVEYQLQGVNQVQVNAAVGLTFARGLRTVLRQDPNIVMVGEIRDQETAEIATRAALTGHLVLSTLHTNSAVAAIPRLIDMGIEPYLVVSSLSGVMAQRLVRRICTHCKESYEGSSMDNELMQTHGITCTTFSRGRGCTYCGGTGYKGRIAVHELLVIDDRAREMMMNHASVPDIRAYARSQGMCSLLEDGLDKVRQGVTTVSEILRVTSTI